NWLQQRYSKALKEHNITIQQYNILRILNERKPKPTTISMIRERMFERESDVSRLVDNMRKKELIYRYHSEEDKRVVHVFISEKGSELLEKLSEKSNYFDNLLANLSSDDIKHLNSLIDRVREIE
ncbi:MAG: MarR family transcriptional regulator, partial [Bacteroidota bacterium]